jgi:hypothetical protein
VAIPGGIFSIPDDNDDDDHDDDNKDDGDDDVYLT